ncbi:MAG: hemolysin III family protein [Actinomycetota bacterium]|nr:hemolysin III family protein [Actinomycetota bacterium]
MDLPTVATATVVAAPPKPLLRGWMHLVSFPVWAALGLTMVAVANVTSAGTFLLLVYVLGTGTMFGVSALYHRGHWQPQAKLVMQKLDHSAIFLAIAGGYTPIAWVCLDGWVRVAVLASAWLGAVAGIVMHWVPNVPRVLRGGSYMVVSWAALLVFPQLATGMGAVGFSLLIAGGLCYTVGAISLLTNWPNPWPRVFGFHEVFHAFTVVAAGLQFAAISYAVVPQL